MRRHSLLIIDDDLTLMEQLVELFRMEGYAVATATDGLDALRLLTAGEQPDLLLMDMHMEGLGGEELATELRVLGWPLPILLITADPDPAACATHVGAQGYLAKPFELPVLLAQVEQLLWEGTTPSPYPVLQRDHAARVMG